MNARSRLNQLLQSKLRCSIPVEYIVEGKFLRLIVGDQSWLSDPMGTKDNVAQKAHDYLTGMEEPELRDFLGLPPRPHVAEMDAIRDALRSVRKKCKTKATRRRVVCMYYDVDVLEKLILNA